jgi:molybdopterin converting factor small subunit
MRLPHYRTTASQSTITIRCRLFGRYADALGVEALDLDLAPDASTRDAVAALRSQLENAELIPERPLVAINQRHALPDARLRDGDELAILPPLAGG